jgi:hypothetical protein
MVSTPTARRKVATFVVALVCLLGGALVAAAPLIFHPAASPAIIPSASPATVIFTASAPDPSVIPASINLQRAAADNTFSTVGRMYDDGTHGDLQAGDGIYSLSLSLNEPAGTVTFRVSAAVRGSLGRTFSDIVVIHAGPAGPDPQYDRELM